MFNTVVTYFGISGSGSFEGVAAWGVALVIAVVLFGLLLLVLSPAFTAVALTRRRVERVLNENVNIIITQFDPPRGLSPAEIGLLYDMKCDKTELIATLFDLEQRGVITITNADQVKITNEAAYAELNKYEKLAIQLANGETDTLKLPQESQISYTDPNTGQLEFSLYTPFPRKSRLAFTLAVQESIEKKGIPMNNYYGAFVLRVLIVWFILSLWPFIMAGTAGTYNGAAYAAWSAEAFVSAFFAIFLFGMFLFPAYIIVACLVVWIWTKIAGRYWLNTKQARAIWPELEGYKRYLQQVDLDRIQFESTSESEPITKTLPYAIVFGLDTKWQQRIKHRKHS